MKTESKNCCVWCSTPLVVKTTERYLGDPMHRVFGPGGRHQMTAESTTSCPKCGLVYVAGGGVRPVGEPRR